MKTYTISLTYLDDGQVNVQVEGDPYPLGVYNETGWDDRRLLEAARSAIVRSSITGTQ